MQQQRHIVVVSDCPTIRALCLSCDWQGTERTMYSSARADGERHQGQVIWQALEIARLKAVLKG
jgi:hypothetical protein